MGHCIFPSIFTYIYIYTRTIGYTSTGAEVHHWVIISFANLTHLSMYHPNFRGLQIQQPLLPFGDAIGNAHLISRGGHETGTATRMLSNWFPPARNA